jgi:hypothetical protein
MESRGYQGGMRLPSGRVRTYRRLPIALLAVVLTVGFSCSKKSEAKLANEALQQRDRRPERRSPRREAEADYREVLVHDANNKD